MFTEWGSLGDDGSKETVRELRGDGASTYEILPLSRVMSRNRDKLQKAMTLLCAPIGAVSFVLTEQDSPKGQPRIGVRFTMRDGKRITLAVWTVTTGGMVFYAPLPTVYVDGYTVPCVREDAIAAFAMGLRDGGKGNRPIPIMMNATRKTV